MNYAYMKKDDYLMHYGVKGMKWRHRKNRPLSREERVTEGNGHVSVHGNGLLVDYGIDDKVGSTYGPRPNRPLPSTKKYGYRPLSRQERVTSGDGSIRKVVTFKQAAKKDAEKKAKLAKMKRPKSRKELHSFGDSQGVRRRRRIYGYKMRQAVK